MTPDEARSQIQRDSRWKASVAEGYGIPVYEHDDTKVRLFETIADATFWLDSRIRALKGLDYELVSGTKARGTLHFKKDGEQVILVLDRVPKKEKKRPERAAEEPQLTLLQGGTK